MIEWLKNNTIRKYYLLKLANDKEKGYLYITGWIQSFKSQKPVDKNGEPQAWFSLPANHFLNSRLNKNFLVFEYGSGNSSLYFSKMVKEVHSVEHDKKWYEYMQSKKESNMSLLFRDLDDGYTEAVTNSNTTYDIIVVDGRKRVECAEKSLNALNENGILVLDDSDREKYRQVFSIFKDAGYKSIDFWGMGLGSIRKKSTTLFYRTNNCLNI